MNTITNPYPEVPLPAGAVDAIDWQTPEVSGFDETYRIVWGAERALPDEVRVLSSVCQLADGSLKNFYVLVCTRSESGQLDSRQARQMAAYLLEAAAELDRWAR